MWWRLVVGLQSTAKLKESYERKLQNQEEEFRGQLEALRSKFQSLYREGIETQKEKVGTGRVPRGR